MADSKTTIQELVNKTVFKVDMPSFQKTKQSIVEIRSQFRALKKDTAKMSNIKVGLNVSGVRKGIQAAKASAKKVTPQDYIDEQVRIQSKHLTERGDRLKMSPNEMRPFKDDLKGLIRQFEQGTISAREFRAETNRVTRGVSELSKKKYAAKRVGGLEQDFQERLGLAKRLKGPQRQVFEDQFQGLLRSYKQGNMNMQELVAGTRRLNRDLRRTNDNAQSLWGKFEGMRKSLIGMAVTGGALWAAQSMVTAGKEFDAMRVGMTAVFGKNMQTQMEYTINTADKFGVSLRSIGKDYTKFAAAASVAGIEIDEQKFIFEGFLQASRVFGLTAEQSKLGMRAIVQSMSKGKVSSDELKEQLGEHLPATMNIAAKAMGMVPQELFKALEQGQIMSAEFWPKFFAEYNKFTEGGIDEALKTYAAAEERVKNSFYLMQKDVFKKILEPFLVVTAELLERVVEGIHGIINSPLGTFLGSFIKNILYPLRMGMMYLENFWWWIEFIGYKWGWFSLEGTKAFDNIAESVGSLLGKTAGFLGLLAVLNRIFGVAKLIGKVIATIVALLTFRNPLDIWKTPKEEDGGKKGKSGGRGRNKSSIASGIKGNVAGMAMFGGLEQAYQAFEYGESDISKFLYSSNLGEQFMDRLGAGLHFPEKTFNKILITLDDSKAVGLIKAEVEEQSFNTDMELLQSTLNVTP